LIIRKGEFGDANILKGKPCASRSRQSAQNAFLFRSAPCRKIFSPPADFRRATRCGYIGSLSNALDNIGKAAFSGQDRMPLGES
jgi:hypothetical protein